MNDHRAARETVDWASVEPVVTADGSRLQVWTAGEGVPVVLVHGGVISSTEWVDVAAALSPRCFRLITYDQRGHGRSSVGRGGYDVTRYGEDLGAVLSALDVHDAILVGHSMGGIAILSYFQSPATDWRRRIRGLVLASTTARGLGGSLPNKLMAPLVRRGLLNLVFASPAIGRLFLRPMFGPRPRRELIERARQMMAEAPKETKRHSPVSILDFDLRHVLPSIDVPVRVLVGSSDRATPVEEATNLAESLPAAGISVLVGVGHFMNLERPEAIADAVRDLVRG